MEQLTIPPTAALTSNSGARVAESRVGRFAVTALAAVALPPVVWAMANRFPVTHGADRAVMLLAYAGAVSAAFLALVLVWRRNTQSGTFALALFLALLASFFSHSGLYAWAKQAGFSERGIGWLDMTAPATLIFMTAALVRFSALFPQPLDETALGTRTRLRSLRVAALRPRPVWIAAAALLGAIVIANTLIEKNAPGRIRPFALPVVVIALLLSVGNIRLGYRVADAAGRRRMFWVMEGFLLMGGVLLLGAIVKLAFVLTGREGLGGNSWFVIPGTLAFFLLLVCLTIAMFFSGALDPTLAIERTAVYGLVGIALVFLFTAVESAVHEHVKAWIGLSDSSSGVLTGGIVALSVEPLKHRITHFADRVLQRFGVVPKKQLTH